MRRTLYLCLFIAGLVLFAGCSGNKKTPTPTVTPIVETPTATPTPLTPVALIDSELLGAPGVQAVCDHPEAAQLTCKDVTTHPQLDVSINASTYARWSMKWNAATKPLTGNETLALRVQSSGKLEPNLYLVEQSGKRISVSLGHYGLVPGSNELHIPLHEIKDKDGNELNYADVNQVQIVFEWANMAGTLALDSLRFDSVWQESVTLSDTARSLAANLLVPTGFAVQPVADNLSQMTQIQFMPDGSMLVSLQGGRVWWYKDSNGDGIYDTRHLYLAGFPEIVGLLYDPVDGSIWIGGRGQLVHTLDSDGNGVADVREVRIDGLKWGRHQNNGLAWNPDPDPFSGEKGHHWIYFGLGSVDDLSRRHRSKCQHIALSAGRQGPTGSTSGKPRQPQRIQRPVGARTRGFEQTGRENTMATLCQ